MARGLTAGMRRQRSREASLAQGAIRSSTERATSNISRPIIPQPITPQRTNHADSDSTSNSNTPSPVMPQTPQTPQSPESEGQIQTFMEEQRSFNERAERLLQQLSDRVGNNDAQTVPVVQKRAPLPLKLKVRFDFKYNIKVHAFQYYN